MTIKIIMHSHRLRKEELVEEAVKNLLYQYGNPNEPSITNGYTVWTRKHCPHCGVICWTPDHQHVCDECASLIKMERDLNQQTFRKERELRLRELEEKLAET